VKTRLLIVTAAVAALAGVSSFAVGASASDTWGCVVSSSADAAVCLHDPIPHPLPTVNAPAPALPAS
jgi:hypothetical protein